MEQTEASYFEKNGDSDQNLFGYYIIPEYQCDLEKYINLSKNGKVPALTVP